MYIERKNEVVARETMSPFLQILQVAIHLIGSHVAKELTGTEDHTHLQPSKICWSNRCIPRILPYYILT